MGLVDGVEDSGVAGVVGVLHSVLVQREGQIVDVRHLQSDLAESSLGLESGASHLVQSLLHGLTVHTLVTGAGENIHHSVLHTGSNLIEVQVAPGDGGITEGPLRIDRGAEQAIGDLGQRGELVLVEVNESTLRGLHDVQVAETSLQADLHGGSLALLALHVRKACRGRCA